MNILKKYRLRKQQQILMQEREVCERLQTEHSKDKDFYRYIQAKMDSLNEEAEHIRGILEGRWTG